MALIIAVYCYKVSCITCWSAYWSRYTYHKASVVPERVSYTTELALAPGLGSGRYQKVRCNLGVRADLQCA